MDRGCGSPPADAFHSTIPSPPRSPSDALNTCRGFRTSKVVCL
jgi:hypothetical protein